jgi:hypothetical protein
MASLDRSNRPSLIGSAALVRLAGVAVLLSLLWLSIAWAVALP